MMRKMVLAVMVLVIINLLCMSYIVYAEGTAEDLNKSMINEYSDIYEAQLNNNAGDVIDKSLTPYSNGFSLSELIGSIASGDIPFNLKSILTEFGRALFGEFIVILKSMIFIVALAILSSFLSSLGSGFGDEGVHSIAYYVCFMAVAGIASRTFFDVVDTAAMAIENMVVFMRCIVPIMITSLLMSGAIISSVTLEPVLIGVIEVAVTLIKSCFMPLVMVGTALGIVNTLSDKLKTTGLVSLINSGVKYGVTSILTIFIAFAGLKSVAASGADGLTIRLTKFASANLIPVIGGILSESVETVMRCSSLIKNSVGILGVIIVFFIAIIPLIRIVASFLVFKVVAAVCEPISEKRIVECITTMGNGIGVVFSMLAAVTIMFIIIITIMINISI